MGQRLGFREAPSRSGRLPAYHGGREMWLVTWQQQHRGFARPTQTPFCITLHQTHFIIVPVLQMGKLSQEARPGTTDWPLWRVRLIFPFPRGVSQYNESGRVAGPRGLLKILEEPSTSLLAPRSQAWNSTEPQGLRSHLVPCRSNQNPHLPAIIGNTLVPPRVQEGGALNPSMAETLTRQDVPAGTLPLCTLTPLTLFSLIGQDRPRRPQFTNEKIEWNGGDSKLFQRHISVAKSRLEPRSLARQRRSGGRKGGRSSLGLFSYQRRHRDEFEFRGNFSEPSPY